MAGLAAGRAHGRYGGRPRLMTRARLRVAMAMMAYLDNLAHEVALQLGASTSTLYACVDGRSCPQLRAWKLLGMSPEKVAA